MYSSCGVYIRRRKIEFIYETKDLNTMDRCFARGIDNKKISLDFTISLFCPGKFE
jgi:hypothetical protein